MNKIFYWVFAVVLAAAAALKAAALVQGRPPLPGAFPPGVEAAAVSGELLLAVWLVSDLWGRAAWTVAGVAFGLFGLVSLNKALAGAATCGCFGAVPVDPRVTLGLDAGLLLALLVVGPPAATPRPRRRRAAAWATAGALLASLGPAAFLLGAEPAVLGGDGVIAGNGRLVVLEPDNWASGRRLPVMDFIDMRDPADDLSAGRWRVVFFRHDCAHCQAAMPSYEKLARQDTARRVALIEIEPPRGALIVAADTACRVGRLSASHDWFVETPAAVDLLDGDVTR